MNCYHFVSIISFFWSDSIPLEVGQDSAGKWGAITGMWGAIPLKWGNPFGVAP
ncbi:MAG TPA: hypothetical protein VEO53_13050 [Candidatus Binatia bacterium]|nr:hypothetical protein [Candidatus Binatia bacterium]